MATNIKGPAIFLAQFAGDAAPFNSCDSITQMGGVAGLQGRADSNLGRPAFRSQEGGGVEDLLRRGQGHGQGATASRSPSSQRICRASSWRSIRPMTRPLMPSRRRRFTASPRSGRNGRSSRLMLAAKASKISGSTRIVTFSGALAWPYVYPWPQRPPGLIETAFERTGQALEADPRCL